MTEPNPRAEIEKIEESLRQLEAAKANGAIPAAVADASIAALKKECESQRALVNGNGALAQGDGAKAVGQGGVLIEGDLHGTLMVEPRIDKFEVVLQNARKKSLPYPDALAHYLNHIIVSNHVLRLQGIQSANHPMNIALEKVYISLSVSDQLNDGQTSGGKRQKKGEIGYLSIAETLNRYLRVVVVGDPGCGKTTLLSYLGLSYARTMAGNRDLVRERLNLKEAKHLPVLLPLRDFGQHLKEKYPIPGKDGPALLLDFLYDYYQAQQIALPEDFFDAHMEQGRAVILLDGMDEVAETSLRIRVARIIEGFATRYEKCRYIVTSRQLGYEGAARIGADFGLARVRDFTPREVRKFIHDWARAVETSVAGNDAPGILYKADEQSKHLIAAIEGNPRVADLAVNPLLLTVVALVHRYRAQLPERRSELYDEAVNVLLGRWDEAKGLEVGPRIGNRAFDIRDWLIMLEPVAFWMQEQQVRDIELDDLKRLLLEIFEISMESEAQARSAVNAILTPINLRNGLLVERGVGIYSFAHLTFQEYLAARSLAEREDMIEYTLRRLYDPWWREVILLEAGYLSTHGKRRVSELIRSIMHAKREGEPEPLYALLLAAECLFDVGALRVEGKVVEENRSQLQSYADQPIQNADRNLVLSKIHSSRALARIGGGKLTSRYWSQPYGEPEWINIPAGEFWMGCDTQGVRDFGDIQGKYERPLHKVYLPDYKIARVPITNAQYALYVQDANVKPPTYWRNERAPIGREDHPVVGISWSNALSYCRWLSRKIDKPVTLPSEAEWEKAARGTDKRQYPWGNDWQEFHCNSNELGLLDTVPIGVFLNGASPYGVLDMVGNIWEWTRSLWGWSFIEPTYKYPYNPNNISREDVRESRSVLRILRGGPYIFSKNNLRCSLRASSIATYHYLHEYKNLRYRGFRVSLPPTAQEIS